MQTGTSFCRAISVSLNGEHPLTSLPRPLHLVLEDEYVARFLPDPTFPSQRTGDRILYALGSIDNTPGTHSSSLPHHPVLLVGIKGFTQLAYTKAPTIAEEIKNPGELLGTVLALAQLLTYEQQYDLVD